MNGDGAAVALPHVDVNDGIYAKAVFDTAGVEGPYAGYARFFYMMRIYLERRIREMLICLSGATLGNENNLLVIADNDETDINPMIGVYETVISANSDEGAFLKDSGRNIFQCCSDACRYCIRSH